MRKLILGVVLLAALCAPVAAQAASAQAWPERAVRLVVPYPPGGNVDGAARIIANKLQEKFGQPFVIENKAGAGGLIAGEYIAKSPADGYTLFIGANGPILFAPTIAGRDAYQWQRDFAPISTISLTPILLQMNPSVPVKTLAEFFDLARREPGKLNMSSPGPGTANHLLSRRPRTSRGPPCTTRVTRRRPPT